MKKITIANRDTIQPQKSTTNGSKANRKTVVSGENANKCNVTFFELESGKGNTVNVYHYHETSEEIFYIISGKGIMQTEEGDKEVKAGDAIVCPAYPESAHLLINNSDSEKLIYINIATVEELDLMYIPKESDGFILSKNGPIPFKMNDGSNNI